MNKTEVFRHIAKEHIKGAPANPFFDEVSFTLFKCLYINKGDTVLYDVFNTIHLN